jgi:acyl-CoA synthetase (AMP-forming)/AMP-acid ligase II
MLPWDISKMRKKLEKNFMKPMECDGSKQVTLVKLKLMELSGIQKVTPFLLQFLNSQYSQYSQYSLFNYRIVDRKKDLVKLQHGEYISYGKVESVLKTAPIIENICMYADPQENFAVAVVIPALAELATLSSLPPEEAIKQKVVQANIVQMLTKYGLSSGLEKVEIPQKVALTLEEWTPETGLVTAAFKIRRRFIVEKYQEEINAIYK